MPTELKEKQFEQKKKVENNNNINVLDRVNNPEDLRKLNTKKVFESEE